MKTIPFRKVEVYELGQRKGSFSYQETLYEVLSSRDITSQQGFTLAELRMSTKILDKLDAAKEDSTKTTIDLEDAEHSYLVKLLSEVKWNFAHRVILDFVEAITKG